jgi:flagellar basal-body rod modification protein FlgD
MTVTAATGSTTTPAAPKTSTTASANTTKLASSAGNDQLGKDTFLKLLVAQLRYQNPLSPMDGTEFIAQTAQLTMTERLEEISKVAKESLASSNIRAASDLVGRTITYDDGKAVVEGKVDSARMNGGAPVLFIGKTEVPLGAVLSVRSSPSTPTPSTPTPA